MCAAIPLLVEHLFVHEHVVTTVTQAKNVETRAPVHIAKPDEVYDVRKRMLDRLEQRRVGEGLFACTSSCANTSSIQHKVRGEYDSDLFVFFLFFFVFLLPLLFLFSLLLLFLLSLVLLAD